MQTNSPIINIIISIIITVTISFSSIIFQLFVKGIRQNRCPQIAFGLVGVHVLHGLVDL